jgi:5,10-methylenetetrahydromethanopterin reductase
MEIGVGLDATLGLSWDQQRDVSKAAAKLGYTSIWTPEGNGQDSFHLCVQRWQATADVIPGGLTTGIAVSPVMYRTPLSFAMEGGTVSEITGGKFIMGIGSGGAYRPQARAALGVGRMSALALMRDYLTVVRGLVRGERVDHEGPTTTLKGMRLGIRPAPETPVYLGALGPRMLELSGELADGASLNWCTPEQIAWSRERIAEGATRAGRDTSGAGDARLPGRARSEDAGVERRAGGWRQPELVYTGADSVEPGADSGGRDQGRKRYI